MRITIKDDAHRAQIEARVAELKTNLAKGGYPSADAYYGDKDCLRDLQAALIGTTAMRLDPMGFWFGSQSA